MSLTNITSLILFPASRRRAIDDNNNNDGGHAIIVYSSRMLTAGLLVLCEQTRHDATMFANVQAHYVAVRRGTE